MRVNRAAWWFVAPALLVITIFFFLPIVCAFLISLTDFDIYSLADLRNLRFVGLANYLKLLETPLFWQALGNTLYFVAVGVPLSIGASLGAALLLHSRLARFKPLFRTALFAPVVTTLVAVAVIWRYMFNTRYGLLNYALGGIGIDPIDWLGDPHWAMPAIILFAVWKNFGYNMIIFLAGLQSIPEELYEAARIDGASIWRQFASVTLPMLSPVVLLVGILTIAGYFQLFAEPYVMTQGGPLQSTVSVLYFMYEEGFKWWNLGSASAMAFVLFLLIFGFKFYKSTPSGQLAIDQLKLKLPVIKKAMSRILAARFARTLSTLTSSGVSLTQSLRIGSKVVANKVAENRLLDIEEQIKRGKSLHTSISTESLFPSMLTHMVKIG
jgi:multiple sugar transport system permease protein